MRRRVGGTEVSVLARENKTTVASAPGNANLAKSVPFSVGRTHRNWAYQAVMKDAGRQVGRSGKTRGKEGIRDSGFRNRDFSIPNNQFSLPSSSLVTGHILHCREEAT